MDIADLNLNRNAAIAAKKNQWKVQKYMQKKETSNSGTYRRDKAAKKGKQRQKISCDGRQENKTKSYVLDKMDDKKELITYLINLKLILLASYLPKNCQMQDC